MKFHTAPTQKGHVCWLQWSKFDRVSPNILKASVYNTEKREVILHCDMCLERWIISRNTFYVYTKRQFQTTAQHYSLHQQTTVKHHHILWNLKKKPKVSSNRRHKRTDRSKLICSLSKSWWGRERYGNVLLESERLCNITKTYRYV